MQIGLLALSRLFTDETIDKRLIMPCTHRYAMLSLLALDQRTIWRISIDCIRFHLAAALFIGI